MKKFFAVVFFCLPAFGQATYSGPGLLSGSGTHSGQPCGPGNGYACFVQTTGVVNLTVPIPSWGPNTCDSTSLDTLSTCGNLTGASPTTVQTPSDFGNAMARCTDVNTTGVASDVLTTQDDPYPAIWNINDTAFLAKKASSAEYILKFNPATLQCTMTSVSFPIRAIWSHTDPYHLFSLGGSSGVVVSDNTVASDFSSITSTTTKYDFNNSSCLTNPVNGYSAGGPTGFNATSYSVFLSSLDDTFFSEGFSNTGGQGTGVYVVAWTVGQSGCDLYNTATGTVTHNGVLVGNVPDQWGGAAYGGIPDLFYHHSVFTPLSDNYVIVSATASNYIQGNQTAGNDLLVWNVGTTSIKQCGIAAVNWTASHTYSQLGYRISPTSGNAGGYIYQIITAGNEGTSGGTAPTWNQTPGSDTVDATVTWRNIGLGAAQKYACDGHTWNGYSGFGAQKNSVFHSYADPSTPRSVHLIPSPAADDHYGATNDNADDTAWMFAITGVVSKPVNLLGTLPGFGYYEGFFISPVNKAPGVPNDTGVGGTLGQTRRAFHTYNTGYDPTFDVQNGVAMLSQTGKFALVSTDGMGQFGNLSGQAKCNIGGTDWNPNDVTVGDYAVGQKVFPNPQSGGSNNGHYIYVVQDCNANGGGGVCKTGATKPTFVQSATVAGVGTFTENSPGTITYVAAPDTYTPTNTAVQNCRADLLVVKLTR